MYDYDDLSPKFGLPPCLWIPIAAINIEAIEKFVGQILDKHSNSKGIVDAILVKTRINNIYATSKVKLWKQLNSGDYKERLYPEKQVWVHVNYAKYRKSYIDFHMPDIPNGYVLDHIQNRESIRLREYSHPYLRLCPVSHKVNTNGGGTYGGEGLEKEFLKRIKIEDFHIQKEFHQRLNFSIQYADPMDLTKMLNIPPGTKTLKGMCDTQTLFYE